MECPVIPEFAKQMSGISSRCREFEIVRLKISMAVEIPACAGMTVFLQG
jgi:hypothetical protein